MQRDAVYPKAGGTQTAQALREEIIPRVNELFDGKVTEGDWVVYGNEVLKRKLLESRRLAEQAHNNTKAQFATSPDLNNEIVDAIMDAFASHEAMSKQALDSDAVRAGSKDILLGPGRLWELLRGGEESE